MAEDTPSTDDKPFNRYKETVSLIGKYQAFAAELLRISLLGIALLGFFVDKVSNAPQFTKASRSHMLLAIGVAALCFGFAAASALAHRYYSTEALQHLLDLELLNQRISVVVEPIRDRLRWLLFFARIFPRPEGTAQSMYDSCSLISSYAIGVAVTFAGIASLAVIACGFLAWWGYAPAT